MSAFRAAVLASALLLPVSTAKAHPHAWIDLASRLIFDEEGRIEAIELDWLFDEFYTVFIAEEFTRAGLSPSDFLKDVAAENLANLREYDYFTEIEQDGAAVAIGDVRRFETGIEGERLWLKFELPLATPIDPGDGLVSLAVFDPTYYIEILYHEGRSPVLDGVDNDHCTIFVMPPTPTPDQVAMAFALDFNQAGPNGLGRYFAEIATIDCSDG